MTAYGFNNGDFEAASLIADNITINGNTISSTDTNGNVILAPDGTGVVSVTTAAIVPSGDRADSLGSSSNSWDNVYCDGLTFDDGTNVLSTFVATTSFTPVLAFGGGSTGITYSNQFGRYSRINNLVFVIFTLGLTNKGSSTGVATITGLPITAASNANISISAQSSITLDGGRTNPYGSITGTTISLYQVGSGTALTTMSDTNFSNTSLLAASFTYFV